MTNALTSQGTIIRHLHLCLFAALCLPAVAAQDYDVIDLGAFNGTAANQAVGINQNGQAACLVSPSGFDQSFLFTHRRLVEVGTLGGITQAYAINDNGDIVGQGFLADQRTGHAFLKRNDITAPILDLHPPGYNDSYASAINNVGQIVGYTTLALHDQAHAFVYSDGVMNELDPTVDYSYAAGINDEGEIVGEFTPAFGTNYTGFVWFPAHGILQDIGTLQGGSLSSVLAVNNSGYFVGWGQTHSPTCFECYPMHALLGFAQPGQKPGLRDLGSLAGLQGHSRATAINNRGEVVGNAAYTNPDSGGNHAFLLSANEMIDLNDHIRTNSGWNLEAAEGINDCGQIVGFGHFNGRLTGFMLNPRPLVTNVLSQADPRWGNQLYDHSSNTIQSKGCALTSLCMALIYAGLTNLPGTISVPNTPGTLNDFLNAHSGFAGSGVNWEPAVDAATQKRSSFLASRFNSLQNPASAFNYLNTILCSNKAPVIVGVIKTNSPSVGHFVLVTGKVGDDYLIADPGHNDRTNLAQYRAFETRGFVTPLPVHQALGFSPFSRVHTLVVAATSDLPFTVDDSGGNSAGWDPVSGEVVEQIRGSSAFWDALDDDITGEPATESSRSVYIDHPAPGSYQTRSPGLSATAFTLMAQSFYAVPTPSVPLIFQGELATGSTITNLIPVETILQLSPLGGGHFRLRLGSDTGLSFNIETSHDLAQWVASGPCALTNGLFETGFTNSSNVPGLFFRAKSVP